MAEDNKYEDEIWGDYFLDKRLVDAVNHLQENLK